MHNGITNEPGSVERAESGAKGAAEDVEGVWTGFECGGLVNQRRVSRRLHIWLLQALESWWIAVKPSPSISHVVPACF